jgi:hypothetical protein
VVVEADHSLLNVHSSSDRPAEAARLAGIVRLIRRVCLLREQGDAVAAARLQDGELASAITAFRLASGPASLSEDQLCAMFVTEAEHVTEAVVLAELLAPQLARLLPASASGPARPALFAPLPSDASPGRTVPGETPAISDLLDAMLAAERTGRRPSPATHRES